MRSTLNLPNNMSNSFGNFAKGTPNFEANNKSVARTWRLIDEALKRAESTDLSWTVGKMEYRSETLFDPYGIDYVEDMFLVWGENGRGGKGLIAIFDGWDTASEYFVWLVSKGEVEIDWSLYLDMIE